MKKRLTGWCAGALFALTFLLSSGAWAGIAISGVGNAPGDGGLQTTHDFLGGWVVPLTAISANPNAPNWIKTLQNPGLTGTAGLTEFLFVGDGPNWTDWHETVVTPGWAWTDGDLLAQLPGGAFLPNVEGDISQDGSSIEFFFDLPPGTIVIINKTLACIQTAPCEGNIEVREFPTVGTTPEPGSLLLLAAGLLGLAGLRRRRFA